MEHVHYVRHCVLLLCTAGVLLATSHWRHPQGTVMSFGLYGALHAGTLAVTLRAVQPLWRKLSFIAAAASLSMLNVAMGLHAGPLAVGLPGRQGPFLLLGLFSGVGAAAYAMLVRLFWIDALPWHAVGSIALLCLAATFVMLLLGAYSPATGGLWLAIAWWLAFSGGLWRQDRRLPLRSHPRAPL